MTVHADVLKEHDVSKGTIRIPWDHGLPVELIQRIVKRCYEEYRK